MSDEADCPEVTGETGPYHGKEAVDLWLGQGRRGNPTPFHAINVAQPVHFSSFLGKCPTGWHYNEGTAGCYRVYLTGENYWDVAQTCQRVNSSLVAFSNDQELRFILAQEWDQPKQSFGWRDQHPVFTLAMSENDNVFCVQLQCFHFPTLRHYDFHSWHAESCYEKSSFLCKRSQTCVNIKDNTVDEGFYFTPKGDDPCLSCTCHGGEPYLCVATLCEGPQGCQQYQKDPRECCKFMCLDPDNAFEPVEAGPLPPGDGDTEIALPPYLEQPPWQTRKTADSSSVLLVPQTLPRVGAPQLKTCHSHRSLNTMV
ncbi:Integral membrane protein DGCR2/IDD [Sciurus carolinensis]|uniref:Integral membrane protein DGCR2/IDD n=1 Tax=Sciurus carolinensis TaxID=30640 RepID=A0AA41MZ91_SCICA|nr:Integral membrane protein DGCR2/IDD [Sciurus carolinensis]